MKILNKIIVCLLISALVFPVCAQPVEGVVGSYIYIPPGGKLPVNFPDADSGAWCYDDEANMVLLTAASRAKARCELVSELKITQEKAKFNLKIELLKAHIISLKESHEQVLFALKEENLKLGKIAMDRPTNKGMWYAAGGFVTGVAITIVISWVAIDLKASF